MPDKTHAYLAPSSAEIWLNCPPAIKLSEGIKDEGSPYTAEGTDAHSLCEYKLKKALGMEAHDPTEDLSYYDSEMEEAAEGYTAYALEKLEEAKKACHDPLVLIEQHVDFSRWVPEGFGTADCTIVADETLYVIDFKYGKGVEVDAHDNPQMKCYALGTTDLFDALYDIKTVSMSIYQPRLDNISEFEISKVELYRWADEELKPKAELAYKGEGEFKAGTWCRFCKAKTLCRARAEANLKLAQDDFKLPPMLTDTEVLTLLPKLDLLKKWAEDILNYALKEALSGKHWDGWKLVEGKSNRKYKSEAAVAEKVEKAGFNPYEKKLLGITAMEKLMGKKKFNEVLKGLVVKPHGKPALVPEDDERPELKTTTEEDFKEVTT